jgi:hypothetical protein
MRGADGSCVKSYLQKAEIRRIAIRFQPGKIIHETLSQKAYHTQKIGLVE